MLVVKIELWPHGDRSQAQVLATGAVVNTGEGTPTRGEYRVTLFDKAQRVWKTGKVKDFPRKRLLAWDLLYRALKNMLGDRN